MMKKHAVGARSKVRRFARVGAVFVLVLVACATPRAPILHAPGERVHGIGYSVLFPTEPGWIEAPGPATQTSFVVKAEVEFASRSLQVEIMPLPDGAGDEAGFREFVARELVDDESPRFVTHVNSVEIFLLEPEAVSCADVDLSVLQRDAVAYPGHKVPMTLQIAGRLCQHPEDRTVGVMLGASYRFPSGEPDSALRDRLTAFRAGFQFEPLP